VTALVSFKVCLRNNIILITQNKQANKAEHVRSKCLYSQLIPLFNLVCMLIDAFKTFYSKLGKLLRLQNRNKKPLYLDAFATVFLVILEIKSLLNLVFGVT